MISRPLLRLPSPLATSLLHHLTRLPPFSKPSFCPNNGATFTTTTSSATVTDTSRSSSTVAGDGRKFPRPSTITFSPRLQNSVSLIGAVEFPLKQYNTGARFGVHTVLRVNTSPDYNSFFSINLEMWDELAERAMLHLKQYDFIYVSGDLCSFKKTTSEGVEIVKYKVTAKELNYVEPDEPGKRSVIAGKYTGENLGESALQKVNSRLHLIQVLFANPNEWYDNRKNKKNPKAPDFKHKSTGEAIWLHTSDPPWVKKQLELLDSRHSEGSYNNMSSKLSHGLVSDEQLIVSSPSVEELNCTNLDEGGKNSQRAVNSGNETGKNLEEPVLKRTKRLQLLEELFANPDEWDDLRKSKKNQREPDFKHKSTGKELWINASDPSWVNEGLVLLGARRSSPSVTTQRAVDSRNVSGKSSLQRKNERLELLQNLFANPEEWYDNRNNKKNPKQPDFKHKSSGEAIWLNETDPPWVKDHVKVLDSRFPGEPKRVVVS